MGFCIETESLYNVHLKFHHLPCGRRPLCSLVCVWSLLIGLKSQQNSIRALWHDQKKSDKSDLRGLIRERMRFGLIFGGPRFSCEGIAEGFSVVSPSGYWSRWAGDRKPSLFLWPKRTNINISISVWIDRIRTVPVPVPEPKRKKTAGRVVWVCFWLGPTSPWKAPPESSLPQLRVTEEEALPALLRIGSVCRIGSNKGRSLWKKRGLFFGSISNPTLGRVGSS